MRSELQSGHDFKKELEKRLMVLTTNLNTVVKERDELLDRLATVAACDACNVDLSFWTKDCSPSKDADKAMDRMLMINDDDMDEILTS